MTEEQIEELIEFTCLCDVCGPGVNWTEITCGYIESDSQRECQWVKDAIALAFGRPVTDEERERMEKKWEEWREKVEIEMKERADND